MIKPHCIYTQSSLMDQQFYSLVYGVGVWRGVWDVFFITRSAIMDMEGKEFYE